jgi:hypothetical protein
MVKGAVLITWMDGDKLYDLAPAYITQEWWAERMTGCGYRWEDFTRRLTGNRAVFRACAGGMLGLLPPPTHPQGPPPASIPRHQLKQARQQVVQGARERGLRQCQRCQEPDQGTEKFKCCSLCKVVFYCSKECQVEHWRTHKRECAGRALQRA